MCDCDKVVLVLLYIFALVAGIFAVLLPFWVSTEVENGVQELQVNKKIDSGLWWKYERLEVKQESFNQSDDGWTNIKGTSLDTKSVHSVTALMMTGMSVLIVSFIGAIFVLCCSWCDSKHKLKIPFIVLAVTLFLAAGFMAIGTLVFFKQVLDDYKIGEDEDHLGVSFWLAVTSSVFAILAGIYTCYQACCTGQRN